jgi:hypothetical protein
LLLEPQRTNLVTFSEQLDNASVWYSANTTITANIATSPDGTQNADRFATTAANGYFSNAVAIIISANASTYTQSIFVKWQSGSEVVKLRTAFTGGTSVAKESIINIRTGVVVSTDTTAQVVSYGNGWYRISHQATNNSTNTTAVYQFYPTNDGTNTNVIYLWGAQLEEGAYATSYIPTTAASVTRVADAASKTGISSLIGQTEGTLFGEFTFTGVTPLMHMFASVAGSYTSAVYVQTGSSTGISMQVWSGATNQVGINFIGLTVGQNVKFAAAYKANDFMLYVNGVQAGSSTSGSVPAGLSQLEVGSYAEAGSPFNFNSSIKQAIVFKTRLTNAEMAELTTL